MRIAWLAPYPPQLLEPALQLARHPAVFHPCSWIVNLSHALAQQPGVELHLVTESPLVPADKIVHVRNITFHVIRSGVPWVHRGYPPWLPLDVLTGFSSGIRKLTHAVQSIGPDLVHGHGTEAAYALAAVSSGRPCLVSMQGIVTEFFKTNPSFRLRIVRRHEQAAVRAAHFFACRTEFDSGFIRSLNPRARIFTIHEAMHPAFFGNTWEPRESDSILFVGSVEKRKGLAALLEALAVVRRSRPAASLKVIGGAGPAQLEGLRRQCARLGIEKGVQFLGFQPADAIARHHRDAQVFVLPSENENSPNALAEAMVSGLPVVATTAGGIPSMVEDGETGLLVPPGDPQKLAAAIARLLADPAERRRLAANAARIGRERHRPETVAQQTVAAYREILYG